MSRASARQRNVVAQGIETSAPVILRRAAQDDALDVLRWRNDPVTRAMSRAQDVVEEAAHLAWFARAIDDPRRTLLIGELGGQKVGIVRFDHGEETEVSINLNPDCRGRGLSYALLSEALAYASGPVIAEIRPENLASVRLFERAGFVFTDRPDGLPRYTRAAGAP